MKNIFIHFECGTCKIVRSYIFFFDFLQLNMRACILKCNSYYRSGLGFATYFEKLAAAAK